MIQPNRRDQRRQFICAACAAFWGVMPILASPSDAGISGPAYTLINGRTAQNQSQFFVYQDVDSGFNHGFPSGFFGNSTGSLQINAGCLYSATSADGCSSDAAAMDQVRGTVFQLKFASLGPPGSGKYAGLNFEEPQGWGTSQTGNGYNLAEATQVTFKAISPTGGISVQFSIASAVTPYMSIPQQWTQITISLSSLGLTPSALSSVNLLFGVASNDINAPAGGVVLLDDIQFLPVPASQSTMLGFPLANQVFGIVHVENNLPGDIPIPPDQINSNLATVYESSLAALALLARAQTGDVRNAALIADSLVYALGHDNQGDPLPVAPDNSTGLHNGTSDGDLALFNSQGSGAGQQGQVRLAGFTAPQLCPPSDFCLVLDGATGGNNAFAIMALIAAYKQTGNSNYLNAATTIGNWIYAQLLDATGTGYGGYYAGYPDQGLAKILQTGKSTENNADIFMAFNTLSNVESALNNPAAANLWMARANVAGDFVMHMFDNATGHFYAGTVPSGEPAGPGIDPSGAVKGNDVINTFDFLDAQTFTTLAMAGAARYQNQIDWRLPVRWVVSQFAQNVTANGFSFQGFNLIDGSEQEATGDPAGVAWEFTGQAVAAMQFVDSLYNTSEFAALAGSYLTGLRQAQTSAPFGDGQGLAAATLQDGQSLPPYRQCLVTPFQCIAERVGLAATAWAVFAEQGVNPMAPIVLPACTFNISPSPVNLDSTSQAAMETVTASATDCYWTASATGGFITITSGGSGTGNGTVAISVAANATGAARAGALDVGAASLAVTQRATATVFADVSPADYFFDFSNVMYTQGITAGCSSSPLEYCPSAGITRGEMAVFLVTAVEGGNVFTYTATPYFTDVPVSNPFFKFVQKLRDLGITSGCSATEFCPDDIVTRGQMAAFIVRARYETTPYDYPAVPYFTDVPPSYVFFPFIQKMAQTGITAGCAPTLYCPDAALNRGQMAVFIVTGLLNQLLPAGAPYIASAAPNTASPGQEIAITLTGTNTHFDQTTTHIAAAPGIAASNPTVTSPTSLTVQLAVDAGVPPNPTSIVVTTGGEEAVLPNRFVIAAAQ